MNYSHRFAFCEIHLCGIMKLLKSPVPKHSKAKVYTENATSIKWFYLGMSEFIKTRLNAKLPSLLFWVSHFCTVYHKVLRLICNNNRPEENERSSSTAKSEVASDSPVALISALGTNPFPHAVTTRQDISLDKATEH